MRRFLLLAAVSAVTVAKPELYKEKEDFKYSRSSSDDGSKAGFYGAQRGNMGGNYERAHNMDTLAQHQMSGLVKQVDGELGDGVKSKTGSVYSAANSRGIYGSGNYDLSNLEGRNFQEGTTYGQSQASSLSHHSGYNAHSSDSRAAYISSQAHNSRHHSGYNTYQSGADLGQDWQSSNLHAADNLQAARNYDYGGRDSLGYYSNTGYHGSNSYAQSSSNLQNSGGYGSDDQTRIISAMPVRVVVRPGTRVAIPIATQTYDSTHRDSSFDQNAIGSEAEILNNRHHQTNKQSSDDARHYESSYSYRKEWEKHDTIPVIIPTLSPYPKNSELYEDNQALTSGRSYDASRLNTDNTHSSNAYTGYENHARSASTSQSRQQSNYNAQHESSSSGSNLNAYGIQAQTGGSAAALNLNNQVEDFSVKPKSYQTSYSYHKSWERQGDPYIIKPATNDISQTSQRITSDNQYGSQYYDSQRHGSHTKSHQNYYSGNAADCDENGHVRVARSYNIAPQNQVANEAQEAQNLEDLSQQTQTQWDNQYLGQQTQQQWGQLEDEQQTHKNDNLENLGQQIQNKWDSLEDLGQQTQNTWNQENVEQQVQKHSDNLEDLGQQTQSQWDMQVAGQQIQGVWDNFEQSQQNKLDLSQQTQDTWTTLEHGPRQPGDKTKNESFITNTDAKLKNVYTFIYPSNREFINQEITSDSQTHNKVNAPKETSEEPQAPDMLSIWRKYESNNANEQNQHNTDNDYPYINYAPQQNNYFHQNQDSIESSSFKYDQNHQQTYHESHTSRSNTWNPSASSFTQNNSHDNFGASDWGSPSLVGLWDKIDTIEQQSSTSINKDFLNNTSEHLLNKEIVQDNVSKSINDSRDNYYSSTDFYKPTISYVPHSNDSTTAHKLHPSDIGRGDIGPEDSDSSEDKPTSVSNSENNLISKIPNTVTNSTINAKNNENDTRNLFHVQNEESESSLSISSFNHQKWFENENAFFEPKSNSTTTTNSPISGGLTSQDTPLQSFIVEQQNKQENTQELSKYNNEFKYQSTEKQSPGLNITHRPKDLQPNTNNFNLQNMGDFKNQSDNFDQQNVSPHESYDQQNIGNLEQFAQQSDHFDQQNVSPHESYDQQNIGNLEQFAQQSDNFDQQNVSPQESFDQQNVGNLEQFAQQNDNFDQQNVSPQESFDQQNVGNLEQFAQQSDNFDQQNVSPQESFDQQNIGNLEQFAQQSDNFDQQNVSPHESFDQQNIGNLEQFAQQSDNFDQQNVSPHESFDQQNIGNLEQFAQQSDNFDQQNASPHESFDQQNIGNLEQFAQQSDNFDQQNVSPQESLDQQNMGDLEQFVQKTANFDQQNVNNDDLVVPYVVEMQKPEMHSGQEQAETFQQQTDDLIIPLQVRPLNSEQVPGPQHNEDQGQQVQSIWESKENIQQQSGNNNLQNQNNIHEKQGRENVEQMESIKKDQTLDTPPETATEKAGFWKSVGNKFATAKDKVASWFSRG